MTDLEDEGNAHGHLIGLIEIRGLTPEAAVELASERFDVDREVYEDLVEEHWS